MPSEKIPSTASSGLLAMSGKAGETPRNLSTNIAEHLLHCMKEVTRKEITPKTVNAACQCAAELYKVMKLNIELKKIR